MLRSKLILHVVEKGHCHIRNEIEKFESFNLKMDFHLKDVSKLEIPITSSN